MARQIPPALGEEVENFAEPSCAFPDTPSPRASSGVRTPLYWMDGFPDSLASENCCVAMSPSSFGRFQVVCDDCGVGPQMNYDRWADTEDASARQYVPVGSFGFAEHLIPGKLMPPPPSSSPHIDNASSKNSTDVPPPPPIHADNFLVAPSYEIRPSGIFVPDVGPVSSQASTADTLENIVEDCAIYDKELSLDTAHYLQRVQPSQPYGTCNMLAAFDKDEKFPLGLDKTTQADLGSPELPTIGSLGHSIGRCKPCAFVSKLGCASGVKCSFCHLCDPGEKKRRRKERKKLFSVARKLAHQIESQ